MNEQLMNRWMDGWLMNEFEMVDLPTSHWNMTVSVVSHDIPTTQGITVVLCFDVFK
jgi:hypothetical protein